VDGRFVKRKDPGKNDETTGEEGIGKTKQEEEPVKVHLLTFLEGGKQKEKQSITGEEEGIRGKSLRGRSGLTII